MLPELQVPVHSQATESTVEPVKAQGEAFQDHGSGKSTAGCLLWPWGHSWENAVFPNPSAHERVAGFGSCRQVGASTNGQGMLDYPQVFRE